MSRQLREIASWRIATELIRRHPKKLTVLETHPAGGLYDCLTLIKRKLDNGSPVRLMDMNRVGSLHVHRTYTEKLDEPVHWPDIWEEMSSIDDPKVLLSRTEGAIGLSHHGKPPVSNGEVLAYRVITALLSTAAYGRTRWECRNGYLDSSGYGGGPEERYFTDFPVTRAWLEDTPNMPFGIAHYGFWFLLREDTPVLCFHVTGRAADRVGNVYELVPLYQKVGRILPMAVKIAGTALR